MAQLYDNENKVLVRVVRKDFVTFRLLGSS